MHDMAVKGRSVYQRHPEKAQRGERNSKARLTDSAVIEIRRRYAAGGVAKAALAREYGVSDGAIYSVVVMRSWQHVKAEVIA